MTGSFLGEPQPVEVLHAGEWLAGELLGWRHDEGGACRVRVRCVVDGLRRTAWTDLATLRLPRSPEARGAVAVTSPPVPRTVPPRHPEGDTRPHPLLPGRRPLVRAVPAPRPRRTGLVDWLAAP